MSDDLVSRLRNSSTLIEGWRSTSSPERHGAVEQEAYDIAPSLLDAATALTEARAEIERLRATTVGDWASQRENDALTIEKYEWKERAEKAESELSTLRARVREVVGPFSRLASDYIDCGWDKDDCVIVGRILRSGEITSPPHVTFADFRAARKLVEDLKNARPLP